MLYIGNPPKGEMSQSALLKDQNTKTSLYMLSKNHWIIAFFMNFWVHEKKIAIYSLFVTTCNSSFKSVSSQKANDSNLTIVEEYLSCHGFGGLEVNIFFRFPPTQSVIITTFFTTLKIKCTLQFFPVFAIAY